ncbi:MAG: DUF4956 domain-containing protein [Muribaculaceae bacterium]|nr:DUF4956 domain-containing protein [Muribaculaceae bacterium]
MESNDIFGAPLVDIPSTMQMLFRFFFNSFFVWIVIHLFYYRKSRRLNYYFTFWLLSISVFFLIYLLGGGGIKIKIGMALGLFAIFGIIRYRTEVVTVREMTYLFVIIAMSVINALAIHLNYTALISANVIIVFAVWLFEYCFGFKQIGCKHILYDRVNNIKPEQYDALLAEIKERTGLDIVNIEVGAINYLQDTVMLKVYYVMKKNDTGSADKLLKLPKED